MKKIYTLFLLIPAIIALSSCGNDWLDLNPTDKTETGMAITKLSDAQSALIGIYDRMQDYEYYGARMIYYGDVTGDDFQSNGDTKRCASFYRYAYTAENAPSSLWSQPYKVIRFANNILSALEKLELKESERAEYNDVKGQALFLRAMAHFDITKVYGYPYTKDNGASWGAAIITAPTTYNDKPSRSSVADCYNKLILPDLIEASKLMYGAQSATQGRVNRWCANLLLSRAYLYMGDNKNALATAIECIQGAEKAGYKLVSNSDYAASWKGRFSPETLFELVNSSTDYPGNDGIAYLYWDKGYDDIILTQSFYDLLASDKNDVRLSLTTKGTKKPSSKKYNCYLLKYANDETSTTYSNIVLYRLAEAYLNAAEAAVKLNDNNNAIKYLNPIVKRANPAKSVSGTVTLSQVLTERRKELCGEGHRMFDLLRNGLTIKRTGSSHSKVLPDYAKEIDLDNYRIVLPVPKYEIDANPQIKEQQNPGWN